ncbi:hypothetical protein C7R92_11640 [Brevibacillus porteri]|uniref:Uncharacterized protein n=1 Tax=Brevibacillus porteri TaxID=2126350 RepID=A0ABX5FQW3_9BACL|nr:hypothetical protein C7R92_11640 [Brevibacillus porteri]
MVMKTDNLKNDNGAGENNSFSISSIFIYSCLVEVARKLMAKATCKFLSKNNPYHVEKILPHY